MEFHIFLKVNGYVVVVNYHRRHLLAVVYVLTVVVLLNKQLMVDGHM
jgi:hypothetical protein